MPENEPALSQTELNRAYAWACAQKWAMRPGHLSGYLDIALGAGENPQGLAERLGRPLQKTEGIRVQDVAGRKVAVATVEGPLFKRESWFSLMFGATSYETLARDLRVALDDTSIAGILLNVDSPGGEVAGANSLAQMVKAGGSTKPVHAFVEGDGASAAYWIPSAASRMTLDPTAVVGSIGVVMTMRQEQPEPGRHQFVSSNAPYKRPDLEGAKADEHRTRIQKEVDAIARVFTEGVAANRGVSVEDVNAKFGQGGVLVGADAVAVGMADGVGGFEQALLGVVEAAKGFRVVDMGRAASKPARRGARMAEDNIVAEHGLGEIPVEWRERFEAMQASLESMSKQAEQNQKALEAERDKTRTEAAIRGASAWAQKATQAGAITGATLPVAQALHAALALGSEAVEVPANASAKAESLSLAAALERVLEGGASAREVGGEYLGVELTAGKVPDDAMLLRLSASQDEDEDDDAMVARFNEARGHKAKR